MINISLPSTLTDIGDAAFNNCSFSSVVIPASVTRIGHSAFTGNDELKTVYFEKNDGWYRISTISNPGNWQTVPETSLKDPQKAADLLLEEGQNQEGTYGYYWRQNPPM